MTRPVPRGLTLIELIVAMTIFALVAIMGLQALTGSLRLRDRLTETSGQTAVLIKATALLRNDLSAAMPMLFFPPDEAPPISALAEAPGGSGFSLSLGGQPALAALGGGTDAAFLQRVDWRLDATQGRLTRRAWPTLFPVSAEQAGPDITVLDGVRAITLRSYWGSEGWIDGLSSLQLGQASPTSRSAGQDEAGSAPEIYSDALPLAMEITLDTNDHGRITLLEVMQ